MMKLADYIEKYYGGNKSAFARAMGVRRDIPLRWIEAGWFVANGLLCSPQRDLPPPPRDKTRT